MIVDPAVSFSFFFLHQIYLLQHAEYLTAKLSYCIIIFFWQIIEFGLTQHRQSILVVLLPPQSLSASVAFLSFANAIFFYYFSVKKDIFFNPAIDY